MKIGARVLHIDVKTVFLRVTSWRRIRGVDCRLIQYQSKASAQLTLNPRWFNRGMLCAAAGAADLEEGDPLRPQHTLRDLLEPRVLDDVDQCWLKRFWVVRTKPQPLCLSRSRWLVRCQPLERCHSRLHFVRRQGRVDFASAHPDTHRRWHTFKLRFGTCEHTVRIRIGHARGTIRQHWKGSRANKWAHL